MHMGIGAVVGATRYNVVLILQASGVVDGCYIGGLWRCCGLRMEILGV